MTIFSKLILLSVGIAWFAICVTSGVSLMNSFFASSPKQMAAFFPLIVLSWVIILFIGQYVLFGMAKTVLKVLGAIGPALSARFSPSITLTGNNLEIRLEALYISNSSQSKVISRDETVILLPVDNNELPRPKFPQLAEWREVSSEAA